jgi:hypothetical protein
MHTPICHRQKKTKENELKYSFLFQIVLLLLAGALHVRSHVSYMYEDINSFLIRLDLTAQTSNNSSIFTTIDVLFVQTNCGSFLIVVDIYRMADADNRVILNVGGIRHETCMYLLIYFF